MNVLTSHYSVSQSPRRGLFISNQFIDIPVTDKISWSSLYGSFCYYLFFSLFVFFLLVKITIGMTYRRLWMSSAYNVKSIFRKLLLCVVHQVSQRLRSQHESKIRTDQITHFKHVNQIRLHVMHSWYLSPEIGN